MSYPDRLMEVSCLKQEVFGQEMFLIRINTSWFRITGLEQGVACGSDQGISATRALKLVLEPFSFWDNINHLIQEKEEQE